MTAAETDLKVAWSAYCDNLRRWYCQPDCAAVELALCAYVAHWFKDDKPVWMFQVGASSTGKTDILCNTLAALPGGRNGKQVHLEDDLSPTTFLSGFGGGSERYSLLHRIAPKSDPQAILLFSDFTTFLSARDDHQKAILGQLRRISDGRIDKDRGSADSLSWSGKITLLAVCTEVFERAWSVHAAMGDRFVTVRWPRPDGLAQAKMSRSHIGKEAERKELLRSSALRLIHHNLDYWADPPEDADAAQIDHLAEFCAQIRTPVRRTGRGELEGNDSPEGTSSIAKKLVMLAQARAALYRRPQATAGDVAAIRRVAADSCPPARLAIIRQLLDRPYTWTDLLRDAALSRGTLGRVVEELLHLRLIQRSGTDTAVTYAVTNDFLLLALEAGIVA